MQSQSEEILRITVSDSGMGVSEIDLARGRRRGLGLNNIEERLRWYGGQLATLRIRSIVGEGTVVELRLPVTEATAGSSAASVHSVREKRGA